MYYYPFQFIASGSQSVLKNLTKVCHVNLLKFYDVEVNRTAISVNAKTIMKNKSGCAR